MRCVFQRLPEIEARLAVFRSLFPKLWPSLVQKKMANMACGSLNTVKYPECKFVSFRVTCTSCTAGSASWWAHQDVFLDMCCIVSSCWLTTLAGSASVAWWGRDCGLDPWGCHEESKPLRHVETPVVLVSTSNVLHLYFCLFEISSRSFEVC